MWIHGLFDVFPPRGVPFGAHGSILWVPQRWKIMALVAMVSTIDQPIGWEISRCCWLMKHWRNDQHHFYWWHIFSLWLVTLFKFQYLLVKCPIVCPENHASSFQVYFANTAAHVGEPQQVFSSTGIGFVQKWGFCGLQWQSFFWEDETIQKWISGGLMG